MLLERMIIAYLLANSPLVLNSGLFMFYLTTRSITQVMKYRSLSVRIKK
jgi:hypothetical protein